MLGWHRRREATDARRTRGSTLDRPAWASIGVGSLVVVASGPAGGNEWEGEPSGVVVAPGDREIVGYPGLGGGKSWLVAFDELAYTTDGRGPFERATVSSRFLIPAPEVDDDSGLE